jgi:hypothetical protein
MDKSQTLAAYVYMFTTGCNRVEGNRRASRNGRVSDLPPEIPNVTIRICSSCTALASVERSENAALCAQTRVRRLAATLSLSELSSSLFGAGPSSAPVASLRQGLRDPSRRYVRVRQLRPYTLCALSYRKPLRYPIRRSTRETRYNPKSLYHWMRSTSAVLGRCSSGA